MMTANHLRPAALYLWVQRVEIQCSVYRRVIPGLGTTAA